MKRFFAAMLAAALSLCLFCGCAQDAAPKVDLTDNSSNTASNDANGNTSSTPSSAPADDNSAPEEEYSYDDDFLNADERLIEKGDNYILFEIETNGLFDYVYAVWSDSGKLLATGSNFPGPLFRTFECGILGMCRRLSAGYHIMNYFDLKNGTVSKSYELIGDFNAYEANGKIFLARFEHDFENGKTFLLIEDVIEEKTVASYDLNVAFDYYECLELEFTDSDTVRIKYSVFNEEYEVVDTVDTSFDF